MDDEQDAEARLDADAGIDADRLSVRLDPSLRIGSLRYFDPTGAFATAMGGALGGPMPPPLRAVRRPMGTAGSAADGDGGPDLLLAWRSPTETLVLTRDAGHFAAVAAQAAGRSDGCLVDQSSGISAYMVTGARAPDLLTRLGATSAIPTLGEARTGRLAELSVMSLCVRPGEIILLVERVYRGHLMGWIAATVGDF